MGQLGQVASNLKSNTQVVFYRRLTFDLKEEYFETVYHPADLVEHIAYYIEGETYNANVRVADIKGSTHPSNYGLNWLQMLTSLERHKNDFDVVTIAQ